MDKNIQFKQVVIGTDYIGILFSDGVVRLTDLKRRRMYFDKEISVISGISLFCGVKTNSDLICYVNPFENEFAAIPLK